MSADDAFVAAAGLPYTLVNPCHCDLSQLWM